MSNYEQFETEFKRVVTSLPKDTSVKQDMASLPVRDRSILALGYYIQQVLNGGHAQWVGNGYDDTADHLAFALECLETIDRDTALKVRGLVSRALDLGEEPSDELDYERWYDKMDGLDDQFIAVEEPICEAITKFFTSNPHPVIGWEMVG